MVHLRDWKAFAYRRSKYSRPLSSSIFLPSGANGLTLSHHLNQFYCFYSANSIQLIHCVNLLASCVRVTRSFSSHTDQRARVRSQVWGDEWGFDGRTNDRTAISHIVVVGARKAPNRWCVRVAAYFYRGVRPHNGKETEQVICNCNVSSLFGIVARTSRSLFTRCGLSHDCHSRWSLNAACTACTLHTLFGVLLGAVLACTYTFLASLIV